MGLEAQDQVLALTTLEIISEIDEFTDTQLGEITDLEWLVQLDQHYGELAAAMAVARKAVQRRISEVIPAKTLHFAGGAEVKWSPASPTYKGWDNDALLRDVLDSRLADHDTGEILEESPFDKIRACYSLGGSNVRREALRARGLDPADYCTIERAPKVEIIR